MDTSAPGLGLSRTPSARLPYCSSLGGLQWFSLCCRYPAGMHYPTAPPKPLNSVPGEDSSLNSTSNSNDCTGQWSLSKGKIKAVGCIFSGVTATERRSLRRGMQNSISANRTVLRGRLLLKMAQAIPALASVTSGDQPAALTEGASGWQQALSTS